jgi:hypothetical protein
MDSAMVNAPGLADNPAELVGRIPTGSAI